MAATFTVSSPSKPPPSFFFEDDDDFGDFEFAPPPPPPPPSHPATNLNHQQQPPPFAAKSHSGVASDDEDEWGDFIEGNRSSSNHPPEPAMTQTKVWEKPKGALPLSIFGEEEEEKEEPDLGNSTVNIMKGSTSSSSEVTPAVRNGTLWDSAGGGIGDLITDLYGRDQKESDGGKDDGKDDFEENGWEFKGAESDLSGGDTGIQVLANGLEDVRVQNMLSGDYDIKSENGHANSLSQLFSGSDYPTDSTSTVMPEIEGFNLENSLNPNLTSRNVSTLPPAKDTVFYSSAPGKSDPRLDLHGRGNEDLVNDLHVLDNNPDSHRDFNGSCSNGVITKRDSTIDNDDDDLNNWEFKDAISDAWNKHEAQAEVSKKDLENIHPKTDTVNHKKDDSVIPDLFFGAISHADPVLFACHDIEEKKIDCAMNPRLTIPEVSPSTTGVPLSSSLPLRSNPLGAGNENVRDLFDDLYCEANKVVLSSTASLNNENNTHSGVSYFENDEMDDSSWEFKVAVPDICSGESNSLQVQNDLVESTLSAATSRGQEPHSISNSPIVYLTDSHLTTTGGNDSSAPWDFLFGGLDQSTPVDFVQEPIHSAIGVSGSTGYVSSEDNFCVKSQGIMSTLPVNKENVIEGKSTDGNKVITKLEPEVLVDFYINIKDLSHLLVLQHVDDLKKAHEVAKLSGEEAKAGALHQEIREACINIDSEMNSSGNISMEHISKDVCIEKLLETLHQPYIQAFEIEYFLSEKISLAKKHLTSAIQLFNHATLMLRLFNVASWEDQRTYIVAWSKMISACAQELQHGAMIWSRCLEANVRQQILSETQGCQYFIALGEIFRVTEILSVTSTLYKPWLLLNPVESNKLLIEVAECSKFWTSPGLEKALEGIHDLADSKQKERIKSLLDSINFIHSLGRSVLPNHVPHHGDSVCQLSLLPVKKLQEMEMVDWCGKNYLLKLANLWANRISSDSPSLPCINVG